MSSTGEIDATPDEAFDLGWVQGYNAAMAEIAEVRRDHPVCNKVPADDVVTCGWKRTVLDIDAILAGRINRVEVNKEIGYQING